MKVISIISNHSGSGQTTIAVNLAVALIDQGDKVLLVSLGQNDKLYNWLGFEGEVHGSGAGNEVYRSSLGLDVLVIDSGENFTLNDLNLNDLKQLDYDYLFLLPASKEYFLSVNEVSDHLLVCTDFTHNDEAAEIISLQQSLKDLQKNGISLIIPNKINTKEWENNSQQLFDLADHFGYEKIADPIPHCERIHDLPLTGKTVWELSQQNLKAAFLSLVERVKSI